MCAHSKNKKAPANGCAGPLSMGLGGCVDAHPAGAVGVRVRCSENGSLMCVVAREVGRRQARREKLLLKNEGRIVASAHAMRKHSTQRCGAKPTRNKSVDGCESKREQAPYSIQAHRAPELLAVSTDTSRTILSRSLQ
ncbi:hypothetical protein [Variovorax sp. PAMC26660]|uniref:hypothetical protein n=1 Tax=Variovorax sp. PAMC26660 TaxID=2762322 RepID=UPI00164E6BFD|nr:hypothetical protein [Variovorax sp. PAMC26660]QNK70871.1 hypothetical protein H7F35_14815 [Variovorax sp. PAMC26660]